MGMFFSAAAERCRADLFSGKTRMYVNTVGFFCHILIFLVARRFGFVYSI